MRFIDTSGQICRGCGAGNNSVTARVAFTGVAANRSLRAEYYCQACNSSWSETFVLAKVTQMVDHDDIVLEELEEE